MAHGLIDRILLWLVARRLARCRRPGDVADRFGDRIMALLRAEIERRGLLYTGWAKELAAREVAVADRQRRDRAMEQFQGLESENRPQLKQ